MRFSRAADPLSHSIESPSDGPLAAILFEFSALWERGASPRAEDFLGALPASDPAARVELIYHEFCLAEADGLGPDPADYLRRFPDLDPRLGRVLGMHDVLGGVMAGEEGGEVGPGDEIGPYRLLRELGRGGLARVFLAEQGDLDDRLVVLKLATKPSPEARLLARARHPHIVEVLRHATIADGEMYLIAMPFLGGASLADVLTQLDRTPRRSGRDLLAALDLAAAPEFRAGGAAGASRDLIGGLSLAKAVAWIVARVAEAIDHADLLGVTHGDLKPANVLITADGRPLLLDFNLASDWRSCGKGDPGGTLAYMAPERLRAVADPKSAPAPRPGDRHRADIYALGLVLREALAGRPPEVPARPDADPRLVASALAESRGQATVPRRVARRGVPGSIRPILARCLAPDPLDRYARMLDLAHDLDLWRADRPALHAAGPTGLPARLGLWVVRKRLALGASLGIALVAALVAWAVSAHWWASMREQAASQYDTLMDSDDPAIFGVREYGSWQGDDRDHLVEAARRHLDRYAVLGPSNWRARDDVASLPEGDRLDLESWLLEQAWRLGKALADRPESPDDWRRALAILGHVPEWASLAPLDSLRRDLRGRLKENGAPPSPPAAVSRWLQSYARGLDAERDHAAEALRYYREALADRPGAFWPSYRAAAVAGRLGEYDLAADRLRACLAIRPRNPALHDQLAGCLIGLGRADAALAESDRALALDPDFRDAYRNRVIIHARLGQDERVREDVAKFTRLEKRAGRRLAWLAQFEMAPKSGQPSRPVGQDNPPDPASRDAEIRALVAAQLELGGRDEGAIQEYDRILESDPDHLRAKFARANLLTKLGRNEGVNEMTAVLNDPRFDELTRQDPRTLRAYLFVATARLKTGGAAESRRLARLALDRASQFPRPPDHETLAQIRYGLARALVNDSPHEPGAIAEAASLLRLAIQAVPALRDEAFARDPFFDRSRETILRLWREGPGMVNLMRGPDHTGSGR